MKVLVLHSAVAPDAPPEELDTLIAAEAVEAALAARGHAASRAGYVKDRTGLEALLRASAPDIVFNLVEGVDGLGGLAPQAPRQSEGKSGDCRPAAAGRSKATKRGSRRRSR